MPLLIDMVTALAIAFVGGVVVRRLGLPTMVGYLLAGVTIGPFTPGFVGDAETIRQLAELGIVFLMFGVGLHFSFQDLWRVRDIAIVGALGQMATTAALGFQLGQAWGWSPAAAIVLGLAVSVASTVVLLRGLMDNGLLNTPHGQVAVGWLVMEDLATVLVLLVLPTLVQKEAGLDWRELGLTVLAASGFLVFMMAIGARFIPWLLMRVAHTRSRELFILATLTVALGTALGASELFGVSLALGAFAAGAVVNGSPLSHRVAADLLPFREAFSVLFFVSVGMLLDPHYLWEHIPAVAAVTGLIVFGKSVITALWAFLFPHPVRTALVVAAGTSQIGEFSFILGQAGVNLGLLGQEQYALILAGSLLSIVVNPFLFSLVGPGEWLLKQFPPIWRLLNREKQPARSPGQGLAEHLVIIGCGRVGGHLVELAEHFRLPCLVVEADVARARVLAGRGIPTLLGDASNSEILRHAGLERARLLVVTLPEEAASELIVAGARDLAARLPIIVRAATRDGVQRLARLGAQYVIHPELEGGLQLVRHALLELGFSLEEVRRYAEVVRRTCYTAMTHAGEESRLMSESFDAVDRVRMRWISLPPDSPWVGQTAAATAAHHDGAFLAALLRQGELLQEPGPATVFQAGDRLGFIGEPEVLAALKQRIQPVRDQPP
ncbi:cation:proton antiporter [Candidatus Methylocalor cossyra]